VLFHFAAHHSTKEYTQHGKRNDDAMLTLFYTMLSLQQLISLNPFFFFYIYK